MKTTIDVAEPLYKRTEIHAVERGMTLKDVVLASLEREVETDRTEGAFLWQPLTADLLAGMSSLSHRLPPDTFVRSADALHLACASANGFKVVYSCDCHFLTAAPQFLLEGVDVIGE